MIETGLFDIVAHPDALRRGAFRPVRSMEKEHREVARLLARGGMAIEVNTAGHSPGARARCTLSAVSSPRASLRRYP